MKARSLLILGWLAATWLAGCARQTPAVQIEPPTMQTPVVRSQATPTKAEVTLPAANTPGAEPGAEEEVRKVVETFGERMQRVSLLSPHAADEMEANYGGLAAPRLLALWKNTPSDAPGKRVSSPWPARIVITTIEQQGEERFIVTGEVVETSSAEAEANRYPVQLVLEKMDGKWLIVAYTVMEK